MGKASLVINIEELRKDIEKAKASGSIEELQAVLDKYRDAINEMKAVKQAEEEEKAKEQPVVEEAPVEEVAEEEAPAEEVAEEEAPAEEVAEEEAAEEEAPAEEATEEEAPAEEAAEEEAPTEEVTEEEAAEEEAPTEEVTEEEAPAEEEAPTEEVAEEEAPAEEATEEEAPAEEVAEEEPAEEKKAAPKKSTSKKTPLVDTSKMVMVNKPAKATAKKAEEKPAEEKPATKAAPKAATKPAAKAATKPAAKTAAKTTAKKAAEEPETKGRQYNGKYEVYQDGDGYAYTLKASNGEILVVSETYANRDSVLKAIDAVKRNVDTGDIKVFADKHGQYKFKLTSKNYRVLALGSNYSTEKSAQRASESFKKFALKADIVDVEVADSDALNATPIEIDTEEKQGGKFIVEVFDKEYSWDLKANNGQILCQSTSYTSRKGCLESIDRFKNAVETGTFKCTKDKKDMYCYKLYGANGRVCAVGEAYPSKSSAVSAANSVVAFYKNAELVELKEGE